MWVVNWKFTVFKRGGNRAEFWHISYGLSSYPYSLSRVFCKNFINNTQTFEQFFVQNAEICEIRKKACKPLKNIVKLDVNNMGFAPQ